MLIFPLVSGFLLILFLFISHKAEKRCEILLIFLPIYQLISFPEKNPHSNHLTPYAKTLLPVAQDRIPVTIANHIILHFFPFLNPNQMNIFNITMVVLHHIYRNILQTYPPLA